MEGSDVFGIVPDAEQFTFGRSGSGSINSFYGFRSGLYGVTKLIVRNLTNGYFFFLSPVEFTCLYENFFIINVGLDKFSC